MREIKAELSPEEMEDIVHAITHDITGYLRSIDEDPRVSNPIYKDADHMHIDTKEDDENGSK